MSSNRLPKSLDLEGLTKACGHAHTFGRCVNRYSKLPDWLDYTQMRSLADTGYVRCDVEEKLKFIRQRLTEIGLRALDKGLDVQCITEHPQFGFYGIPFDVYEEEVRPILAEFESGNKYSRPLKMPWGLELEIIPSIDLLEVAISDEELPVHYGLATMDMIKNADILLGGVHEKFYRPDCMRFTEENQYFEIMLKAIQGLGRLRTQLEKDESTSGKKYVLPHPWYCLGLLKEHHSTKIEMRFTRNENERLAHAFIENGIVPEFNTSCMAKGHDELASFNDPYRGETTVLGMYIDICAKQGIDPRVSFGNDSHTVEKVNTPDVSRLAYCQAKDLDAVKGLF